MSGLILHLSADDVSADKSAPLVVPHGGGRYSLQLVSTSDEHHDLIVWLGGSMQQLDAACRRLSTRLDMLAADYGVNRSPAQ